MSLVQKKAPDFKGQAVVGTEFKEIKLSDYKDKWMVLFFYPFDFTFVCPTEITAFSDAMDKFKELKTDVVGCSIDSQFVHKAWIATPRNKGGLGEIKYPLLADVTKEIATNYQVLNEGGAALRGLFIIDPKGVVRCEITTDLNVGRSVEEVLRLVEAFQYSEKHGEVCPANWEKGQKTINTSKSEDYFKTLA